MTRRKATAAPTAEPRVSRAESAVVDAAPPERLLDARGCEVWRASWQQLAVRARELGGVDCVCLDAPYSDTTHAGHGTMARWGASTPPAYDGSARRDLDYAHWTDVDVRAFVETWAPLNRGWFVSLTDDDLAPVWKREFRRVGLTAFASVACVISGMTVRMAGDGPSSWTIHAMVARPKALLRWGTLNGAHVGPREVSEVVGGKPIWLMRALVRDYSRPGDQVADPCGGAMTTAVACIAEGRRFIGGDIDAAHAAIGVKRVMACPGEQRRLVLDVESKPMRQDALGFGRWPGDETDAVLAVALETGK